ncbi:MAG: PKD domain-containing protein [Conexibacter sp.]
MSRSIGHGRPALLLAALVALLLACAAPAGAATGFLTDDTLTRAAAGAFDVAMAPNGYAIVGWVEGSARAQVVRVSVRPPGGTWSAPESFPVGLDYSFSVSVAIASSGAAAVTWEESTAPTTDDVGIATRAPGGAFTRAEVLREGTQTLSPSVGIAADGTVTLFYAPNPRTVVREFAAGSSALAGSLQLLSSSCPGFNQHLAVAPSGDAVAGWECGGANFALRRNGSWAVSPVVPDDFPSGCSSTTAYTPTSVAIDAAGDPVGVLQRTVTQRFDVIGACLPISTTVDASLVLPLGGLMTTSPGPPAATGTSSSGFGFPLSGPTAGISPTGIVFAWLDTQQIGRAQQEVRFFGKDGSGGSAPQLVGSESAGAGAPGLAVAAGGRALLAWPQLDRPGDTTNRLEVAERPPGGTFGAPAPIDTAGAGFSKVAISDGGDGFAAWTAGASPPYELHVRGYDATGPALSGVSISASATVGVPATFRAAPFDVWGPLTTSWSFGDGATATGTRATHSYASAGTFTASVTSTDALGNAVTRSGTVQVSAAAAGGGSGAPALTHLSLTHRRFRVGRRPTPLRGTIARRRASTAPVGTTFRFTLDRPANVRIGFARQARGVRDRDGDCVRPSRRLAGGRRCRLFVPDGTLVRSAPQGAVRIAFSGRVGRRALRPGRYHAGLTAAVGGRSSKPAVLSFRVVR